MSLNGVIQGILRELEGAQGITGFALFQDGNKKLFSTLSEETEVLARSMAIRLGQMGRLNDFAIKRLLSSSLIAIRGPGSLVVALEGKAPDGVLISIASRLVSKSSDLGPGADKRPNEPAPPVNLSMDAVPVIRKAFSTELTVDDAVLTLLRSINGVDRVKDLLKSSGLDRSSALNAISELLRAGIVYMKKRARPEEDRELLRLANIPYELDKRFSSPEEALMALGEADELMRLLVVSLKKGLTAMDYKRLAEEAGLEVSLASIIRALESLRAMGIARRKGEKRPDRLLDRSLPSTAISVLLMTRR